MDIEIPELNDFGQISYTKPNDESISLAYVSLGNPSGIPIIMLIGLACSHKLWNKRLIFHLLHANYRVILFDYRDTGFSTKLPNLGLPWIRWKYLKHKLGIYVGSSYSLESMADDVLLLMEATQIKQTHFIGLSLGGMIGQIFAAKYPEKTFSLVSMMSTTGARHLPSSNPKSFGNIVRIMRKIYAGNKDYIKTLEDLGISPEGMLRQIAAIWNAGDRTNIISVIDVPTLVLHGSYDILLPVEHGKHTAELIFGSQLKIYEGMGHSMDNDHILEIAADILIFFESLSPIKEKC